MDRSQYFFRTVAFSKQGPEISLIDILEPDQKTPPLEPWLGLLVQLADGQHTIDELLRYVAHHYRGTPPAELERTVASVLHRLEETKVVLRSTTPVELPYYLSQPIERLDLEKARRLIEDGGD